MNRMLLRFLFPAALCLLAPLTAAQKPAPAAKGGKPAPPAALGSTATLPGGSFLGGTDSCTTPLAITGQGTFPFDTTAATTGTEGQNEPACLFFGTMGITNDVWFCWTPTVTGTGVVETCNLAGTLDTKIAAYAGCGCPASGSAIACNDDACGLRSRVEFAVTAGTTYTIQLGSFPGASAGAGMLRTDVIQPPTTPPNDDCNNPIVLPGPGVYDFDLRLATTGTEGQNESLCLQFGTSGITSDVWYTFTASCATMASVTTCGMTSVDTKIAVYPGAGCPTDGTAIACNDDACALQSTVEWQTTAGATYTIQLGTFPGTTTNNSPGMFELLAPGCPVGPGLAGCAGDGSGTACPCGNPGGPGEGCANSSGAGSTLTGTGSTCPLDTVVLTATGAIPGQPGLFFQGDSDLSPGVVFGDGLRCAGTNVLRLSVIVADGSGCAASDGSCGTPAGGFPGPISAHPFQPVVLPCSGLSRSYQYWYRDPAGGPCGAGFNLTNNYTIVW